MTAVVLVLLGVIVTKLAKGKTVSKSALCLSHSKQLLGAWNLHAQENHGQLVVNQDGQPGEYDGAKTWVAGWLSYQSATAATNEQLLVDPNRSLLAEYVKSPKVFKALDMSDVPQAERFWDIPASSHNGAAAVSFADGDVELHTWVDARTRVPLRNQGRLVNLRVPNSLDVQWLTKHATTLAGLKQEEPGPTPKTE